MSDERLDGRPSSEELSLLPLLMFRVRPLGGLGRQHLHATGFFHSASATVVAEDIGQLQTTSGTSALVSLPNVTSLMSVLPSPITTLILVIFSLSMLTK